MWENLGFAPGGPTAVAGATSAQPPPSIQLDPRITTGTVQPGGTLDLVLRSMRADTPLALSEGVYDWVMEGDAGLYLHIHGAFWQQHKEEIPAGIRDGRLGVHLHSDGSIHLHDLT